jgi:hypothetical protein
VQLGAAKFVQPPNRLEFGWITLTLRWALNSYFLDRFFKSQFGQQIFKSSSEFSPNRMAKNKKEAAAPARARRARSPAIAVTAVAAAQIPQLPRGVNRRPYRWTFEVVTVVTGIRPSYRSIILLKLLFTNTLSLWVTHA